MVAQRLRVAAYGVCLRDEHFLLARYVSPDGSQRHWTLPGGKVEHAEDPFDAVVREVAEETGYEVQVEQLLGVDSRARYVEWGGPDGAELHSVGVFYRVSVTGGELRAETDGSTDLARWIPLAGVGALDRSVVIDVGLALHRRAPLTGHVEPIEVTGPLRH
ncbi:NUDIX domain-containing protein [Micromonospora echinofusca]|uniref:NUDIX domain-containing protein n=1 Tax=Micromonospora echinofusca TaxID=47858 RepID=UPI003443F2AC